MDLIAQIKATVAELETLDAKRENLNLPFYPFVKRYDFTKYNAFHQSTGQLWDRDQLTEYLGAAREAVTASRAELNAARQHRDLPPIASADSLRGMLWLAGAVVIGLFI